MPEQQKSANDPRTETELHQAFINADRIIMKKYLSNLDQYDIYEPNDLITGLPVGENVQMFHITRIVYDKDEDTLDKLTTVYNAASSYSNASITMLLKSDGHQTDIYMGVANRDIDENGIKSDLLSKQYDTLKGAFLGNFPGSIVEDLNTDVNDIVKSVFSGNVNVAGVSGIAESRLDKSKDQKSFVQGFEKLLDSMRGQSFSAILIADPVSDKDLNKICAGYEELYSQMAPFEKSEITLSTGEAKTVTDSITKGITDTTNDSLAKTQSHTSTTGTNKSNSIGGAVFGTVGVPGVAAGGASVDYHHTFGSHNDKSQTQGETTTTGTAKSLTEQNGIANALMNSTGQSLQITYDNRAVKTLLDRIDEQIKRIRTCQDFSMYNCGVYFLSQNLSTCKSAASTYRSLMRGENSSNETACINIWEKNRSHYVTRYLEKFYHPVIAIDNAEELPFVTPASFVSGKELPIHIGLPKKSISGLTVLECAEFGREIVTYEKQKDNRKISIGNIYHMHNEEEDIPVALDIESLSMHTFITGSTGSGKSNTIYKLLDELQKQNVNFLVIEPAKGEYKHVFGNRPDVNVFGTNSNFTPLLKINPFCFPEDVHVLEHIDRLIEIFNVCWPMYAAMPAVLKDAVEQAYISCGWDLDTSKNSTAMNLFPTFADILLTLDKVISESGYSEEVKSNYRGSLFTRIKSLTNGINGRIFCSDEIDNTNLFDQNAIIDLSRVGSSETKAMIMGILVMRMQEHRMAQGGMNQSLKHVTVLEEAHNLLRKTSTEQSTESSNLLGKAVEMLANTIAEIRTYGEGFIIADQSPGLLDMSVIRNTNTKIILRLPDFSDRELVGKAAALNDNQIVELSKLQTGVAAVYQNNWVMPVLCKIGRFDNGSEEYNPPVVEPDSDYSNAKIKKDIINSLLKNKIDSDIDDLKERIYNAPFISSLKIEICSMLEKPSSYEFKEKAHAVSQLLNDGKALEQAKKAVDFPSWKNIMISNLDPFVNELSEAVKIQVLNCILREQAELDSNNEKMYRGWVDLIKG